MKKIIFICAGNTCRSPMAEFIANDVAKTRLLPMKFYSAGIHAYPGDGATINAQQAMSDIGIDIKSHRSKTLPDLEDFDYIIPLTLSIKTEINVFYPQLENRILDIRQFNNNKDIADPYGGDLYQYELTRDEIQRTVENIIDFIGGNYEDRNRF